jgi:hypothetical protein
MTSIFADDSVYCVVQALAALQDKLGPGNVVLQIYRQPGQPIQFIDYQSDQQT